MILYNGHIGSLGQYLQKILAEKNGDAQIIHSLLENQEDLKKELSGIKRDKGTEVTFLQIAAMVPVPLCEKNPEQAVKTNVTDTLATIQTFHNWAIQQELKPRVFFVSSCHIYAAKKTKDKVHETDPLAPKSIYAKTKLDGEIALQAYAEKHPDLAILIGRAFGLVAPNQPPNYVLPGLMRRVKERNFQQVPGLDYIRDYLDARDVCQNMATLCEKDWRDPSFPKDNVINICSGIPISIREVLLKIAEVEGLDREKINLELTAAPGRPSDNTWTVGDTTRFREATKTSPQSIPLSQTIKDTLEQEKAALKP